MTEKQGIRRDPNRPPAHPGLVFRDISIPSIGKSKKMIAKELGISRNRLYELIEGKASFTPEMALRFARYFGGSASTTLKLQNHFDIWRLSQTLDLSSIPAHSRSNV